jgi:curli biogenesis system outer membrane secretion channel CsgG
MCLRPAVTHLARVDTAERPSGVFPLNSMKSSTPVTLLSLVFVLGSLLAGCATESNRVIETPAVQAAARPYNGPKSTLVVGKFDNKSSFMRGLFSDGVDRLGGQAKTTLITHLQQTGRFVVVDRENMEEIKREAALKGTAQQLKGADFAITGDITEFGRKEVGDEQFFGIAGSGKQQIAYAKVSLYVVDVTTSEVVYSVQGAGEYKLSNREVLGFGGTSSYDGTLNGKVLDLAIRQALDALVNGIESGRWTPVK